MNKIPYQTLLKQILTEIGILQELERALGAPILLNPSGGFVVSYSFQSYVLYCEVAQSPEVRLKELKVTKGDSIIYNIKKMGQESDYEAYSEFVVSLTALANDVRQYGNRIVTLLSHIKDGKFPSLKLENGTFYENGDKIDIPVERIFIVAKTHLQLMEEQLNTLEAVDYPIALKLSILFYRNKLHHDDTTYFYDGKNVFTHANMGGVSLLQPVKFLAL